MERALKLYDKVFYKGEIKDYLYRLFTIIGIDQTADGLLYQLLAAGDSKADISFYTNRADLLEYVYSGAPKYQFNDTVYYFFDKECVKGVVMRVLTSFSNKQNRYEVLFENGTVLDVNEDQIFQFDPSKMMDSTLTTKNHVNKVRENIGRVVSELIKRGEVHDASKYENPEKLLLDAMEYINTNEGPAPYGSVEYRRRTAILKPMLQHHYAHNSHHPEHYANGVYGMSLMDIVELLCDWQAASVRNKDPEMNITHACERYCIDAQMKRIFMNTADLMGWKYK